MKKITEEEFKERMRLHNMWLKDELGGIRQKFNNLDLSDIHISNAFDEDMSFDCTEFTNCIVPIATCQCRESFKKAIFDNCVFMSPSTEYNAVMADFTNAKFKECVFEKSICAIVDSIFRGATFWGCEMGLTIEVADSNFANVEFQYCHLQNIEFSRTTLTNAKFDGNNMENASFFDMSIGNIDMIDNKAVRINIRECTDIPECLKRYM